MSIDPEEVRAELDDIATELEDNAPDSDSPSADSNPHTDHMEGLKSHAQGLFFASLCCLVWSARNFSDLRNFRNRVAQRVLPRVARKCRSLLFLADLKNDPSLQQLLDGIDDVRAMREELNKLYTESQLKRSRLSTFQNFQLMGMASAAWTLLRIGYAWYNPVAAVSEVATALTTKGAWYAGGALMVHGACWYFTDRQIQELTKLEVLMDDQMDQLNDVEQRLRAARNHLQVQPAFPALPSTIASAGTPATA